MWPVIPAQTTLLVIGALLVVAMVSARFIQPDLWRSRAVRTGLLAAFAGMLLGVALWAAGEGAHQVLLVRLGAAMAYGGVLVLGPAIAVMPIAAGLDRLLLGTAAGSPRAASGAALAPALATLDDTPATALGSATARTPPAGVSRRAMLRATTASLPALAAATGARGLLAGRQDPRVRVIPMRYEGLHPDLEGFRILQLSDLHLGACAGLDDLARGLEVALAARRPDLIVLTGDLADDPSLVPGALDLVARAAARYGAFASLGNHEYLHDIKRVRPLYEAGPIPLLVSAGRTLSVGRARLFVGGADDPIHMHGDIARMLGPSIASAASHAPAVADFRLLLSHRPEGFAPAAEHGFDLTLSGHTHGGQLGVLGRSVFDLVRPGTGWWGTYERRRPLTAGARRSALAASPSRLYTTSGFGHWFPFRVGCPTELPIVVLEGAPRDGSMARV